MTGKPASEIDDEACRWAARLDRGLVDGEDRMLADWLDADTRHRGALVRARAALSLLDRARVLGANDREPAFSPAIGRRKVIGGGVAAAAMLAAGLGWRLWPRGERLTTGIGEIRHLPLADGSTAVVNSGSAVRVAFSRDRRDIELSRGEAWFHVAKNRARPFTVATGPVRVQAVGTAFDVRRRAGAVEVVVTEGVVKVWSVGADGEPMLVRSGERAMIDDQSGLAVSALSAAAADQQLAWRQRRIVLDDMTLAAAAEEFNRYHDVKLVIDPALADRKMVGWFRTDDLDGFVTASATVVGGQVERGDKVIRIVP